MAFYSIYTGDKAYVVVQEGIPGVFTEGEPAGVFMVFRGRGAAQSWTDRLNTGDHSIYRYRVVEATWSNLETRTASSDATAAGCASSSSS